MIKNTTFQNLFKSKFNIDLSWNILSFGLIGVIGILFNVIIIKFYDSDTLGYFNQVYAIYIFLSQVSTWGIHLSIQKYIPQFSSEILHSKDILISSIYLTVLISGLVTCITLLLYKIPGYLLQSENVSKGFVYAIPGLFFFSLNKILLSYMNGMRYMKSFAIFNALRFIIMLIFLVCFVIYNINNNYLTLVLSASECILFIIIFIYSIKGLSLKITKRIIALMKIHLKFGSKAAVGHIVLDINSKADVLILGIFLSDKIVGIYSFAAFIVDGLLQIFYVFRTNINPILTQSYFKRNIDLFRSIIKKNLRLYYKIFSVCILFAILIYPLFLIIFNIQENFWTNYKVFIILSLGCLLSSGYIPFQMIFNQVGLPNIQTRFLFIVFITNVILNFIFIPILGIYGSALATASSFILQVFYLKYLVSKHLKMSI